MGADGLCLHLAEDGAAHFGDDTCSVTVGASVEAVIARTSTAAGLAGDVFGHFDFLFAAFLNLFEGEFDFDAEVGAALGGTPAALLATKATEAAESTAETTAAEEVAEDVAELREDVVHVHAGTGRTVESGRTELVVAGLLVGVAEHIVSLSGFLELFLGFLVAGIAVGMVLQSQFAVGFLQFFRGGVLVDPKYFVIISLCHNYISRLAGFAPPRCMDAAAGWGLP